MDETGNPSQPNPSQPIQLQPNQHPDINVCNVAVKLPPFWDKQCELWFINIEAQFILARITQEITKYYAVVSALNSEVLSYVSDFVKNPPESDRYTKLKKRLISAFSDSEQKRVKDLLSNITLGDDRPSHLLRKMRQLADEKVNEEFLKTLWIQRLPLETQAILSVSEGDLDKLAQMADKILEISPNQVAATHCSQDDRLAKLEAQILALSEKMDNLNKSWNRPSRDEYSRHSRRRSKTPARKVKKEYCYYHTKFGERAHKCIPPCKFDDSKNE